MSELLVGFSPGKVTEASIRLPLSKSECNRALMLSAWSGGKIICNQISNAADSRLLQNLLSNPGSGILDAKDAGTTLRFLTSWLALRNFHCILTGTHRMNERPVEELVHALRQLGCRIEYLEKEGFPPIQFSGFRYSGKYQLKMTGQISSQFVSSLMMAAPGLPDGLEISFTEKPSSYPYLLMTAGMMEACGISIELNQKSISIPPQTWNHAVLNPGADWSAASYFYGILSILPVGSSFNFPDLHLQSFQGDRLISMLAENWQISSFQENNVLKVQKGRSITLEKEVHFDCRDVPDLALTLMSICVLHGVKAHFSGLSSLQIKESRRLDAMKAELLKIGVNLQIGADESSAFLGKQDLVWPENPLVFNCHHDHRIAMALAILLASGPHKAIFSDGGVVSKSFPGFWQELEKVGFRIQKP